MRALPLLCLIVLAHCAAPLKGSSLVPGHGWTTRNLCTDVCAEPDGRQEA